MIDIATVEEYMRTANPIPDLDMLDADELAFAVAAVDTRRAIAMQAPTQHPTKAKATDPAPHKRRRSVRAFAAAFVLILAVVGAAALVLRGDDAPFTDEPAPSTTVLETPTSVVENPNTHVEASPPTVAFDDAGSWARTRLMEPWTDSIVDVAPLPGGGFIVSAGNPWRILWSPDGAEWRDADPQRLVRTAPRGLAWEASRNRFDGPDVMGVAGDRVVVLEGIESGLWVGDPQAGAWEPIYFDIADLAGRVDVYAVASSHTEVIVLGEHRPLEGQRFFRDDMVYLVWLVNPLTGEVERHPLPLAWEDPSYIFDGSGGVVEWVNDRWVIAMGDTILVSLDGATWTKVPDVDERLGWVVDLAAGPTGVVASTEPEHSLWFSEDGLEWENTHVSGDHDAELLYSEDLGFVTLLHETGQVAVSPDGRSWHTVEVDPSWRYRADDGDLDTRIGEFRNLAISGQTVFVAHRAAPDDGETGVGEEGAFLLTYE